MWIEKCDYYNQVSFISIQKLSLYGMVNQTRVSSKFVTKNVGAWA